MPNPLPLDYGRIYHIYNRGTNGENLFNVRYDYLHFLKRYRRYVEPVAETYAYSLLKNHFHLLVRIRLPENQRSWTGARHAHRATTNPLSPSRQFGRLFGTYAQAFNERYGRTGSLFEHPFHRVPVEDEFHLYHLVVYIHRNPQHHGFVDDFRQWRYTSFRAMTSDRPSRVQRDTVLGWFDGRGGFLDAHRADGDLDLIAPLILE